MLRTIEQEEFSIERRLQKKFKVKIESREKAFVFVVSNSKSQSIVLNIYLN